MLTSSRYMRFGLASDRERKDARRREVKVHKDKGVSFSMRLMWMEDELYVVHVAQYTDGSLVLEGQSKSQATHENLGLSAAFRAGLTFGDRIDGIDEFTPQQLSSNHDLRDIYGYLQNATDVLLSVTERPLFFFHSVSTIPPEGHDGLGVTYSHQRITRVETHSSAHLAGLKTGRTIVEVNGASCLGVGDDRIISALDSAVATKQKEDATVSITTMDQRMAAKLHIELRTHISLSIQLKSAITKNLYTFDKNGHRVPPKKVHTSEYIDSTLHLDGDRPKRQSSMKWKAQEPVLTASALCKRLLQPIRRYRQC